MKNRYSIWIVALALTAYSCQPKSAATGEAPAEETVQEATTEQRPSPLEVKEGQIAGKKVKVQYGSPSVKGRTIWGDLVPYNVVWRTGANEATFLELGADFLVEGKSLKAGK